jgi:histidyl-tRNA synthetase
MCRYDGLVGMFSGKDKPAVGVSIGIERVFALLEDKYRSLAAVGQGKIRENEIQVSLIINAFLLPALLARVLIYENVIAVLSQLW